MLIVSTIGTHDVVPHADDVFGVAIILMFFPNAKVIRTRSQQKLAKCNVRVDVGGKYSPPTDFDHHQLGFNAARTDGRVYASTGLVAEHFWTSFTTDRRVFDRIDDVLFSFIDAVDSGVETYSRIQPYRPYDLHSVLSNFIPSSTRLKGLNKAEQRKLYDEGFMRAVEFAQNIIKVEIEKARDWVRDQELVERAIQTSKKNNPRLVILKRSAAWGKAVSELAPEALFVISRDEVARDWRLQTVPIPGERFSSKQLLPREWAGLRGKELTAVTGIEGSIFCHSARFLAIARTKEAILEMAERCLE
jgi:uncharacterized UPF0160 family protein